MKNTKGNQSLESWVDEQLSRGKYTFSLNTLRKSSPDQTDTATKFALKRLSDKGKILSIYKGYYLIIPPQYSTRGILPPSLFLDAFMQFLQRPYYLALLNAAAYHGASHQQPQEFFVITNFPVLRSTQKKGMKINYISIKNIPASLLVQKKTEAGYINISNPVLTATDLIHFEKRIGGINRAASVINELAESIKPGDFSAELIAHASVSAMQRLGYILEFACSQENLADHLFESLKNNQIKFFRIPLKASLKAINYPTDNRWKVIVNTEIEIDE